MARAWSPEAAAAVGEAGGGARAGESLDALSRRSRRVDGSRDRDRERERHSCAGRDGTGRVGTEWNKIGASRQTWPGYDRT